MSQTMQKVQTTLQAMKLVEIQGCIKEDPVNVAELFLKSCVNRKTLSSALQIFQQLSITEINTVIYSFALIDKKYQGQQFQATLNNLQKLKDRVFKERQMAKESEKNKQTMQVRSYKVRRPMENNPSISQSDRLMMQREQWLTFKRSRPINKNQQQEQRKQEKRINQQTGKVLRKQIQSFLQMSINKMIKDQVQLAQKQKTQLFTNKESQTTQQTYKQVKQYTHNYIRQTNFNCRGKKKQSRSKILIERLKVTESSYGQIKQAYLSQYLQQQGLFPQNSSNSNSPQYNQHVLRTTSNSPTSQPLRQIHRQLKKQNNAIIVIGARKLFDVQKQDLPQFHPQLQALSFENSGKPPKCQQKMKNASQQNLQKHD